MTDRELLEAIHGELEAARAERKELLKYVTEIGLHTLQLATQLECSNERLEDTSKFVEKN